LVEGIKSYLHIDISPLGYRLKLVQFSYKL
jgi:hypothetical protein